MTLSHEDLELEAKALLKRAARLEQEAALQREQVRRLVKHLTEARPRKVERDSA